MALKANTVPKNQLDSVLQQLGEIGHVDLTGYKRSMLRRRMEQRMRTRQCATAAQYCALLRREPAEVDALLSALLIKVTSFFRDPPLWEKLHDSVLPRIIEQAGPGGQVRVWSAGCASGEEAYSIAMLLCELSSRYDFSFKVFGTDRDPGAIAAAGRGRFTHRQVRSLSPDLLKRWFEATADGYVARRELRRSIIFGVQDLVADAPISRLHLILCRNLFIYLDSAGQRRSLMHLHQGLTPQGVIALGKSELLPPATDGLFEPLELPLRIYRRCTAGPLELFADFAGKPAAPGGMVNHQRLGGASEQTYAAALDAVDCALVVLSKQGIVTSWNYGAERLYGRMASDVVGKPISRLKFDGCAAERLLERIAARPPGNGGAEEIFTTRDAAARSIRLKVRSFTINRDEEGGMICLASDITELHRAVENMRLAEERQEQVNAKYRELIAQLQASKEALEETNQELRSVIQELQTTNEELQSTNEELEVINEELQLTNAGFEAVPAQQTALETEIEAGQLPQQALMQAGAFAVIGVDEEGRVNLCNPCAARLFNCGEHEMLRRSLHGLSLAPLPEHVSSRIKQSFNRKLPLSLEAFDCAFGADQIKLSCRLTPLASRGGNAGALLIIEPAHGPIEGLQWR